jgi:hypothetical protein
MRFCLFVGENKMFHKNVLQYDLLEKQNVLPRIILKYPLFEEPNFV